MTKATPEELAQALRFFPAGAVKAVQRLLKRAAALAEAAARNGALRSGHASAGLGIAVARSLAHQLTRIMRQRGASTRSLPTLKRKAPGPGGGRPFHFAYSAVGKSDSPTRREPAPGASARKRSAATPMGHAAAHMRYIERTSALEHIVVVMRDAENGPVARDGARDLVAGEDDTAKRTRAGLGAAAAGQGYIENATKVASDEGAVASFGTIGVTHAERVQFWQELEVHEPHPHARIQNRLIIELPHEASPVARLEMVRTFCEEQFAERGLPFWAALHAPGEKNDARNFHVHIVFSERPARRMLDEADGLQKWDFSIVRTKRKASGNLMRQHPYRQNKHPLLRQKDAVWKLRVRFSEIANTVLQRDQVMDRDGEPVRYDPRSYKDMGLDALPLRSLNRIVADKVKAGKLTVLDRDYNRAVLRAELQDAAARRDKNLTELVRTEENIDALARTPGRAKAINKQLPSEMRVCLARPLTSSDVRLAGKAVLTAERIAVSEEVMERSVRSALDRVIEAGDPAVIAASHTHTRDATLAAELPDLEAAQFLHAAALEERVRLDDEAILSKRRAKARIAAALRFWQETVGPDLGSPDAIMPAAIAAAHAPAQRQLAQPSVSATQATPDAAKSENVEGRSAQNRIPLVGSPEFAERLRQASEMTSAIFASIAAVPRLEDRLIIIDTLPDLLNRARLEQLKATALQADAAVAPTPSSAVDLPAPPGENKPNAASADTTTRQAASGIHAGGEPKHTSKQPDAAALRQLQEDEQLKRKRRRERKAVLAKQRAAMARKNAGSGL